MVNDFLIENRTPDPAGFPEEGKYFAICIECGDPIEWDDGTWSSEYLETEDGPVHAECAIKYFETYIDLNKKLAER